MKNKLKFLTFIISITFILATLLGVVHFCSFDKNFYHKEHQNIMLFGKHINEHIGISNDDLDELTSFTLDYLNDPSASLDKTMNIKGVNREVYTDDEKAHMVDVRKLNLSSIYIGVISFVVFIICLVIYYCTKGNTYYLFVNYRKTLIYALIIFGIIGFWIIVDFDSFWTTFHRIFFASNELWLLDLRSDVLIMIVPPEFFDHLVSKIVIVFVLIIILFGGILYLISRKKIKNDSHSTI